MKYFTLFLLLLWLTNCSKDVDLNDVLKDLKLSKKEVPADGKSTVSVTVVLPKESSSDRRSVVFTCSSGTFTGSGTSKFIAKPEFENGVLTAKATYKVSTEPGMVQIKVKPEYDDPQKEYQLVDSIDAKLSTPTKIKLEPSSFGIASNHLSEIIIIGKLENKDGDFVSTGYNVIFEDFSNNLPGKGQFRNSQLTTTDSSMVKTNYSAFAYPLGTTIKIKGTLLDTNGQKTSIADSLTLTINQ